MIPSLLSWRALRVALVLQTLLGATLTLTPLFDVLGFESSLATGFVGSFIVGLTSAGLAARVRLLDPVPPASILVAGAMGIALFLAFPPFVLLLANATRVSNCNLAQGVGFYALVTLPALAVAAAWGTLLGLFSDRPRRPRWAFICLFLAYLLWAAGTTYWTPALQVHGPFFGFFPGTLYESVVALDGTLLTYRVGTLLEITILGLLTHSFADRRLRPRLRAIRRGPVVLAIVLSTVRVALYFAGPALHHRTSAAHLADVLGVRKHGPRCTVIADGRLPIDAVARFLEDCEFELAEVERFFGVRIDGRVTAYLFHGQSQKGRLMGATETFIAKPWRRDVYLQASGFPHPALKHEIAHIVAGAFARPPFRVAATVGGFWPVPGLIEGAAVAADWEGDDLTAHQWSRAMRDAGLHPDPERALGMSFLAAHSRTSYTVAGSFVRFLVERHGKGRFRSAYRSGSVEAAYGRPVSSLVAEWNDFLDGVSVSHTEVEVARFRFDRPGMFARVCAREVARLTRDARRAADTGDFGRAILALQTLVRHDRDDPSHALALHEVLVRARRVDRSARVARGLLADSRLGRIERDQVLERRADLDWMEGRGSLAADQYAALLSSCASEDQRRLRLVKATAAADPVVGPFVRRLILGEDGQPEAPPLAIETLHGLLDSAPTSALGHYLLARQLYNQEDFGRAIPLLERSLELGLSLDPVEAEARRILAVSSYRLGRLQEAERIFRGIASDTDRPESARAEAAAWVRRCVWARGPGRRLAAAER